MPCGDRVLLTGGSGTLGTELQHLLPGAAAPSRSQLDITRPSTIERQLQIYEPEVIVHAAAFTAVEAAERQRERCWQTNVRGTRHIARSAARHGIFLIHLSTDYVFEGSRGLYREQDIPGPVHNYYALSKLAAEQAARVAQHCLIIRTSFRPRSWPYASAYTDMYTSQDYVDVIAPEIALAVRHWQQIPARTLHIATERKSVYELAKRRCPGVQAARREQAPVSLPADVSLDVSRWQRLKNRLTTAQKGRSNHHAGSGCPTDTADGFRQA